MASQLDLYQEVILEHNRQPRNFGEPERFDRRAEGFNPLCGDQVVVYLATEGDERRVIRGAWFSGHSCAICKASASILTTRVVGLDAAELNALAERFLALLRGEDRDQDLGKLNIFATVWRYPARVKCAALPWRTALGALGDEGQVTTE